MLICTCAKKNKKKQQKTKKKKKTEKRDILHFTDCCSAILIVPSVHERPVAKWMESS